MNHWQRIEAAMRGDPTDHPPLTMWRHFPDEDQHVDKLVTRTLEWQNRWQFDLIKFMPCNSYGVADWGVETAYRGAPHGARDTLKPVVERTEDWLRIRDLDVRQGSYGQQNQALRGVAKALGGTVPILQTVFSPLSTARKLATDAFLTDLRCKPDALERALGVITDVTIRFALDALEAGAHGVFLATQFASYRLLSAGEYERFGKPYDVAILEALSGKARVNMLHAHGADIMFDMLAAYPVEMFNWHDRLTEPSLKQAAGRYPGVRVGGVAETGALVRGDVPAIENEVRDAIAQTGGRRLLIGPGCVVPITVSDEAIDAAVRAARTE
jgi:uroporphyrinogen decarboxylase